MVGKDEPSIPARWGSGSAAAPVLVPCTFRGLNNPAETGAGPGGAGRSV